MDAEGLFDVQTKIECVSVKKERYLLFFYGISLKIYILFRSKVLKYTKKNFGQMTL